jgi:hypothetical protein
MPGAASTTGPPTPASAFLDAMATAALLGTGRGGGVGQLAPPGNVAARLAALPKSDAEVSLLELAAAASPWARAGQIAAAVGSLPELTPEAAPDEPAVECTPAAAALLARMLRGEHAECLPEWLDLARKSGVVAPVDALPDLLRAAKSRHHIDAIPASVLGSRGRWLAHQNPDWSFAAGAAASAIPDDVWQTGTRDERVLLLRELRATDPARALALLTSTWETDPADDRAKFTPELAAGLTMADEPFLESCLDDKRKPIRSAAAELLALLPDSRLVQRMTERAISLLSFEPAKKGGLLRRSGTARIAVTFPESYDKSMARDGVEQKGPIKPTGERAWWLQQIVSRVPPRVWCERWSVEPAEVVAAEVEDNNRDMLQIAWTAAAGTSGDIEWMAALLGAADLASIHQWTGNGGFQRMTGERQQVVALRLLERPDLPMQFVSWLTLSMGGNWSADFSRRLLAVLAAAVENKSKYLKSNLHPALLQPAGSIHPSCATELIALITGVHEKYPMSIDPSRALATLEFRAAIHREFTP